MMVVQGQSERPDAASTGVRAARLAALAGAARAVGEATSVTAALRDIVAAAAAAVDARVAVARVLEDGGPWLVARAVFADSPALAAELESSRLPVEDFPSEPGDGAAEVIPEAVRAIAERAGVPVVLRLPVAARGRPLASLELMRAGRPFDEVERVAARIAADQIAAALRAFTVGAQADGRGSGVLELIGEALAAAVDGARTADEIVRLAGEATGARSCLLWKHDAVGGLGVVSSFGDELPPAVAEWAHSAASEAVSRLDAVSRAVTPPELDDSARVLVTIVLGRPPVGALQLLFGVDAPPSEGDAAPLAVFAVRAAAALRASERAQTLGQELERTRTLLSVVAQVNAELSLERTIETFVDRVAELLAVERVAVYLREHGRLVSAAARDVAGPHVRVAERLLDLALRRAPGWGVLTIADAPADRRLVRLAGEVQEAGIETAFAVPLRVPAEVTGVLVAYAPRGRLLTRNEEALLTALAAQLAVALHNAQLHERATELGAERERLLKLERQRARHVGALYEISRSFAQSLSLEATLDAVVRTVVELLEVDSAVVHMPDERGEHLVARALHVADVRLGDAIRAILERPQALEKLPGRRLFRMGRALVLDPEAANRLGPYQVLVPFLEKGATAVVLPIATPAELLGTLTLLSLDSQRPITEETTNLALSVTAQAALAIDNARLYQQQKAFADTMQRSLLPRSRPRVEGLEIGELYASSGRVDVGGDVYDFLVLHDGRLAVVIGDVTGHGVEAAADMAMAKFVFRSLAREHPEPADFLAAANGIVCGEIGAGKFITMLYLTVDPATGDVACASAGHPEPRLVARDGSVRPLRARGLALGVESEQRYDEVRDALEPGGSVVLYTDGVVEARRGAEIFGTERLDAVLADRPGLPAADIARDVLAECRAFARGELTDDCALLVVKRLDG